MTNTTHIRILAASALVTLLAIAVLASTAGAAGKTETLKVFSKQLSFTYTKADGSVSQGPPAGPPQAGDVFEIDSLDYRGTHRKHSKKPIGADYLRCQFDAPLEPQCMGYMALTIAPALPWHGAHRRHRPLEGREDPEQQGSRRRLGLRRPPDPPLRPGDRGRPHSCQVVRWSLADRAVQPLGLSACR